MEGQRTLLGGWNISIHRGGSFKAIIGMKTALKLEIETMGANTTAKAGVGIFGQQAVPTAISMLFFWPVLIPQIWGLIKQSKLDDEAINAVEESLRRRSRPSESQPSQSPIEHASQFCHECGKPLQGSPRLCPECGTKLEAVARS